jgi:hypothetical protein
MANFMKVAITEHENPNNAIAKLIEFQKYFYNNYNSYKKSLLLPTNDILDLTNGNLRYRQMDFDNVWKKYIDTSTASNK